MSEDELAARRALQESMDLRDQGHTDAWPCTATEERRRGHPGAVCRVAAPTCRLQDRCGCCSWRTLFVMW